MGLPSFEKFKARELERWDFLQSTGQPLPNEVVKALEIAYNRYIRETPKEILAKQSVLDKM